MASRDDNRQGEPRDAGLATARVTEQVRDARHEVFRAYVHAREKARQLGHLHDAAGAGEPGTSTDASRR